MAHRTRPVWLSSVIALIVVGLGLMVGLDPAHCLILGASTLLIFLLTQAGSTGIRSPWPRLPYGRRDGARRDVSTLTWTLIDRHGRLSSRGAHRVHTVLHEALRLRDIDPATPPGSAHAEALLGRGVARWLADPDAAPPAPELLGAALTTLARTEAATPTDFPQRKGMP